MGKRRKFIPPPAEECMLLQEISLGKSRPEADTCSLDVAETK